MKKLIMVIAALALLAAPALADENWDFYGSARMQWIYADDDLKDAGANPNTIVPGTPVPTPKVGDSDDQNFDYDIMGTSRIGAKVKGGEAVQGRFEFNNGVGTRLLWGQWKINSGLRLRIGQDWRPLNYFYSGQQVNDAGMAGPDGAGGVISHRDPQVKLIIGQGQNFHLAFVDGDALSGGTSDVDITIPIIEANYHFGADTFFFDVGGMYWTYDTENAAPGPGAPDDSVDAWLIALGGGLNFGPAYFKANGYYGVNVSELGFFTNGLFYDALPGVDATGDFKDNDNYGLLGVVGMRFTDMVAVEVGAGYESKDPDLAGTKEDEAWAIYGHLNYTAAPGVSIIPEIGYINYEDNAAGVDEGDRTYVSIKWQVDF